VEYNLYLANISAPKVGTPQRDEEPYAYDAKKWLMDKVVGQKAEFIVEYEIKDRECGTLLVKGTNINVEIAKTGLVKLNEKRKDSPASKHYDDIVKCKHAIQTNYTLCFCFKR
jgi:staphylococcal nuclease domain-containing protein 1